MIRPASRLWQRAPFTVASIAGAILLLGLIATAIWDSVISARASSHRVYASTLSADLSNFLLSIRGSDGTSLIDNPVEFSAAQRPLYPVSLRRPYFTYLLNRGNAKTFAAEKVPLDIPRSCLLEFKGKDVGPVQACMSVLPDDQAGRFVYFLFRYASPGIKRHTPGSRFEQADRIVLRTAGDRVVPIVLVFHPPTLAASRYPSQMKRFEDVHEMSAFLGSQYRATSQVNAQAIQRTEDGNSRTTITVLGRIHAALLDPDESAQSAWPTADVKSIRFGFEIHSHAAGLISTASPGTSGEAVESLHKAYVTNVTGNAAIRVSRKAKPGDLVWTSESLDVPRAPRRTDWTQTVSDWLAPRLMSLLGEPLDMAPVEQRQTYFSGGSELTASSTATPERLPDIATRAFGWLTAALVLVLLLVAFGSIALTRLFQLTRSAWSMAKDANHALDKKRYRRKRDEISTLGRLLTTLMTRARSRNAWVRKEATRRDKELKLMQEHLGLRQDRLDAIGHEIRSPLQALLSRTEGNEDLQAQLRRMQRAVETLFQAESVEDGINSLDVVPVRTDVATFLKRYVQNMHSTTDSLRYEGPDSAVFAIADSMRLEIVIGHLVDNAARHRTGGDITIRLDPSTLTIMVANQGRPIAEDRLEMIFKYKDSDRSLSRNRGIGLYAARSYLLGMRATIRAENLSSGVAMAIALSPT